MPTARQVANPSDRAGDQRLVTQTGFAKPAVLSRKVQCRMALLSLAVITYGTLGPLGTSKHPWIQPTDTWTWVPPTAHSNTNDLVTNFCVYVPVGIAFRLLVRRRGWAGWLDFSLGVMLSAGLSYTTELLQQFMPARSSSMTDVYVNTGAAYFGCIIAVPVQWLIRWGHANLFKYIHEHGGAWVVLSWSATIVAFILMTSPWEFRRPVLSWGFDQPLADADPLRFGRFAVFAGAAFLLGGKMRATGHARTASILATTLRVALFVTLLEAVQSVLEGHLACVAHVAVASFAGLVGAMIASVAVHQHVPGESLANGLREPPLPSPRMRNMAILALVVMILGAFGVGVVQDLQPDRIRTEPLVVYTPFQGHFSSSFALMLADVVKQCVLFASMTALCLFVTRGEHQHAALLLLVAMTAIIEACQAFIEGHGADPTATLLAVLMWFSVTWMWNSVFPRERYLGPSHGAAPVPVPVVAGNAESHR